MEANTALIEQLLLASSSEDTASASALSEAFGDSPQAMTLALAYLKKSKLSLAEYLSIFLKRQGEILGRGGVSTDYLLRTAASLSVERAAPKGSALSTFLLMLAFFGPERIPLSILREAANGSPLNLKKTILNPSSLHDVLQHFEDFSLLSVVDNAIDILHPLVLTAARRQFDQETQYTLAEYMLLSTTLSFTFNRKDESSWETCALVLPHLRAVCRHAASFGIVGKHTVYAQTLMGEYYLARNDIKSAKDILLGVLPDALLIKQEAPKRYVYLLRELSLALQTQGDLLGAEEVLEGTCQVAEIILGEKRLGGLLRTLAFLKMCREDNEGAIGLYRRALVVDEANQANEKIAESAFHLGTLLLLKGEIEEGNEFVARATRLTGNRPSDPLGNPVTEVLSALHLLLNDDKEETSAETQEKTPTSKDDSEELDTGTLNKMREFQERMIALFESQLGKDAPKLAPLYNELSVILDQLEELPAALLAGERALQLYEVSGEASPRDMALLLQRLGMLLDLLGEREPARKRMEDALDILRKNFGDDHPDTIVVKEVLDSLDDDQ